MMLCIFDEIASFLILRGKTKQAAKTKGSVNGPPAV